MITPIYIKLDSDWSLGDLVLQGGVDIIVTPKLVAMLDLTVLETASRTFEFTDFSGDRYRADDQLNYNKLVFIFDKLRSFQW